MQRLTAIVLVVYVVSAIGALGLAIARHDLPSGSIESSLAVVCGVCGWVLMLCALGSVLRGRR